MLSFKEYYLVEELKESTFDPFYVVWGFIKPDGDVIEKSGSDQEVEGCHDKLIQKLGAGTKQQALRKGWIRWGITKKKKWLFFDYYLRGTDPYAKNAMIILAEKYKNLWDNISVDDEWSGRGKYFSTIEEFKKEVFRPT